MQKTLENGSLGRARTADKVINSHRLSERFILSQQQDGGSIMYHMFESLAAQPPANSGNIAVQWYRK